MGIGVAAFALKYRLGREQGTPYSIEKHAREDGERAMRLVRSRATEWNLDPARIGIMGFSAGGEWGGGATFIVEWAPPGRRGFYGGIHVVTIYLGLALGSAVAAALSTGLSPETMTDWGWRVRLRLPQRTLLPASS